jgi:alpha-L-rhamnosidase
MLKKATQTFAIPMLLLAPLLAQPQPADFDPAIFKTPPAQYRGHAMWNFPLSTLNQNYVTSGIDEMARLNYGGFFIEAGGGPTTGLSDAYLKLFRRGPSDDRGVVFLSDEYFRFYKLAMEEAKKHGMQVVLYDDYAFPTGTVGGQMYSKYPQHMAKSLEMTERDVTGPTKVELPVPEGIYIGAVMMNRDTFELVDISDRRAQNRIVTQTPKGNWKVMAFYLTEGKSRVVDYLDEKAMEAFMSLTYQKYEANLGSYFGNLIKETFYDEPALHHADRMWTPTFNATFQKLHGYSPMKYYPALWYDIGPQTAAARNALWGHRAELFATNFIKRLNDWCAARGLQFGGHLDQEEPVNPVSVTGDLMKVFEHQTLPTVDDIWWYGRSNVSYKIVTSAAFNYDHPIARAETYAAYRGLTDKMAFQVAMDQYAMGINEQIPARTEQPKRAELNDYVGRLSYLLQHGRHVADVAVLYPIASLQAAYHNVGGRQFPLAPNEQAPQITEIAYAREGGPWPPEANYQDVGEALFRGLRVDYTYLHPEVFVSRTTIENKRLILNNRENREEFRVLILPGGRVLSAAAAAKIKDFYDQGGMVIATGMLPTQSAEFGPDKFGKDKEVQKAMSDVFGVSADGAVNADVRRAQDRQNYYVFWYFIKKNQAGGTAMFIQQPHPWLVDFALKQVLPVRDVGFDADIQGAMTPPKRGPDYDGAVTYIHKVKGGRDIYFFANSTAKSIDTKVVLRGDKTLTIWNPHTGERERAEFAPGETNGQQITTLRLMLPSVSSLFFVGTGD